MNLVINFVFIFDSLNTVRVVMDTAIENKKDIPETKLDSCVFCFVLFCESANVDDIFHLSPLTTNQ